VTRAAAEWPSTRQEHARIDIRFGYSVCYSASLANMAVTLARVMR
jgi:hypothetical protein